MLTLPCLQSTLPGNPYFQWREALFLPSWNRIAQEADGLTQEILTSIENFASGPLLKVREFLGCPLIVDCWYRPPAYSVAVGGTATDPHTCTEAISGGPFCSAIDLYPVKTGNRMADVDWAKTQLEGQLALWNIRMENNVGGDWIHLDNAPVIYNRYFNV